MIKYSYIYLKPIMALTVLTFLVSSCKTYYRDPVTIEKAIEQDAKRVKLITLDDRKYIFDSLYIKNEKIYGRLAKSRNVQTLGVQIYPESIKEIYLYNKGKSIGLTMALILGIPLSITAFFFIAFIYSHHEPV